MKWDHTIFSLASLIANDIHGDFEEFFVELQILSDQLGETAEIPADQASIMWQLRTSSSMTYRAVYLFNTEGHLVLHMADSIEYILDLKDLDSIVNRQPITVSDEIMNVYQGVKESREQVLSNVFPTDDSLLVTYVGMPFSHAKEELSQVVVTVIDSSYLWHLADDTSLGETGAIYILSHDGSIFSITDQPYTV